ncbi:polyketide synthase dehydratase domain-containing protein [Candidatus Aerophobetes bacterium]|nr:polyketide synthase dehydratase domain-containing protein [Candidatus Aerophobetes bacterium]
MDLQLEDIAYTQYLHFVESCPHLMAIVCKDLNKLRDYLLTIYRRLSSGNICFDDIEDIYYTSEPSGKQGKIACLFPGLVFPPSLLGPYADHLKDLCLYFPELRAAFDRIDLRDGNPQDLIPMSHLIFPPEYLSEKEKDKLRQRLDVSKFSSKNKNPSERNLAHFGVAVANWASWILLQELKVPVDIMFGPSLGELSALCASGILSFDELNEIYLRAPLDTINFDAKDKLAAVSISEDKLKPLLQMFPDVSIAIHGWPNLQILGGKPEQLEKILQILKEQEIWAHLLPYPAAHTSDSSSLRAILEPFLKDIHIYPGKVPVYSAITCRPYPRNEKKIRQTIIENLDHPVRFWQTIKKMYNDGAKIFIHAGGGTSMHTQAKTICGEKNVTALSLDVEHRPAITQLNHLCATLVTNGVKLNLGYLFQHRSPQKLEIPYPAQYSEEQVVDESFPLTFDTSSDRGMPFIGKVLNYIPGKQIVVERTTHLKEDIYLKDHLFIHAPNIKAPWQCFPVVPITISLEAMAEVAACLVPGFGIIGFEDIKASRWITLENAESIILRVSAQVIDYDPDTLSYRISATIFVEKKDIPAISATILFGRHYLQSINIIFTELTNPCLYPLKAEEIYRDRRLFHGPAFQCISKDITLGEKGLVGELTVLPRENLFASTKTPQLLTDPVILDGAGQLVGIWAQNLGMYVFPINIKKLEIYCPTPPAGTKLPTRLEITHINSKTIYSDIEIQDGTGKVWMRIENWGDWIFRWSKKVFDFRRFPTKYFITQNVHLPHLPEGCVCQSVCKTDLRDFELGLSLVAGFYLHTDELDTFYKLANNPVRQLQWLLGRIAAKDAARIWMAKEAKTARMFHPASFTIANSPKGEPLIKIDDKLKEIPHISIAHSEERAIATAGKDVTGIDLELIYQRDETFMQSITTAKEREIINSFAPDIRSIYITRLWCAKEAAGKALGTGLSYNPKSFELQDFTPEGYISIYYPESKELFQVYTQQDGKFIIAYTAKRSANPR